MSGERGRGRTTAQMLAAPAGAVYVWCNGHIGYPHALAKELKRSDLRIVSPTDVERGYLKGLRKPVVVDHAAAPLLTDKQRTALLESVSM